MRRPECRVPLLRKLHPHAIGRIQPDGASAVAETMAGMFATEKDADIKRELVAAMSGHICRCTGYQGIRRAAARLAAGGDAA